MAETIEVTGVNPDRLWGTPQWAINMAREVAAARGLTTISMDEFLASPEYAAQVERDYRSVERVVKADIRATEGR